jgi:lysophospholipase L1-like esterase
VKGRRGRRARAAVGAVAALGLVVVISGWARPGLAAPIQRYVALGDSYTAGPLIPQQQPNPLGCLRSDHDYPSYVAADLSVTSFRDASCSGASTADMTAAQNVNPGPNPPQLDRLDAQTQVVTVQIGGNDIGFEEVATTCATGNPTGTPCRDHYVVNGDDTISDRVSATAPKVASVLQGIHTRAPNALVLVVSYLAILPETGPGCWPRVPYAYEDVPYLRAKEHQLNAMLAQQAAANDAHYVDVYTASIGHDACDPPCLRWVEPASPGVPAAPLHPNVRGMEATADVILGLPSPPNPPCPVLAAPRFAG